MRLLDHPNVCRVHQLFWDSKFWYIVMEWCSGKSLRERISVKTFDEATASSVLAQLLSVLMYMHDRGIIYRDLKSDNVMFLSKDASDGKISLDHEVRLVDYGLAIYEDKFSKKRDEKLQVYHVFAAPECHKPDIPYTPNVDVWGCGIIAYECLLGVLQPPSDSSGSLNLPESWRIEFGKDCPLSDDARDFITRCLIPNHDQRWNVREAYEHPFIQSHLPKVDNLEPDVVRRLCAWPRVLHAKRAILAGASRIVADDRLKAVHRAIASLDLDGDGRIEFADFRSIFPSQVQNAKLPRLSDDDLEAIIDRKSVV